MKFSIQAFVDLEKNQIIEEMQTVKDISVIVLDNDGKIQFKKISHEYNFLALRLKGNISNNMSQDSFTALMNMEPSEIYHTFLSKNGLDVSAVAVCCKNGRLILMGDTYSYMRKSVAEFQSIMSGYDIYLNGNWQSEVLGWANTNFEVIANLLFRAVENHKFINTHSLVGVSYTLSALINEINGCLRKNRLEYHRSGEKELFVQGTENDFALAAVMIISFCLYNDKESKITINAAEEESDISLIVSSFSNNFDIELLDFAAYRSKRIFEEKGRSAFLIYGVKLISEYNLWEFSFKQDSEGALVFKLKMPSAELADGFGLSDVSNQYISELMEAFFKDFT